MSRYVLITGGCRSGKSGFAVELARQMGGPVTFLATGVACDDETQLRIERHWRARPAEWGLMEEPVEVEQALGRFAGETVLLDCVPTWVANLLVGGRNDAEIEAMIGGLKRGLEGCGAEAVLVVTGEVGDGLVPENELGRRFRDCVGHANQVLAVGAERVYRMTAGLANEIKQKSVSAEEAARGLHEEHRRGLRRHSSTG